MNTYLDSFSLPHLVDLSIVGLLYECHFLVLIDLYILKQISNLLVHIFTYLSLEEVCHKLVKYQKLNLILIIFDFILIDPFSKPC